MGFILFILRLANFVAAISSVALVTMVASAMLFDFKAMHPEWKPEVRETKEIFKAGIVCVLLFSCPVLNFAFAYFCFIHQNELREELFKKLEEELQET